jgi:hypothetical protein
VVVGNHFSTAGWSCDDPDFLDAMLLLAGAVLSVREDWHRAVCLMNGEVITIVRETGQNRRPH